MKKRLFLTSVILAAVTFLTPLGMQARQAANYDADVEVVTESLNSYPLGYMSWGIKHMGLDVLQEKLEKSGKNLPEVRVAVIDSGINTDNKYLKGRYTNDGYNFLNNNTDVEDEQFHGTMVSGIIADGTSSNVKVLPIKVNDANGNGKMKNVEKGIYYAIEHKADVINLSLSADDPNHTLTILDEAIETAINQGIVITVAAGNQQGDTAYRYPANKENVITITAIDKRNQIANKANKGAAVDFALPGVLVFAPYKSRMFVDSGTSLAAPHAAAAAALLKTWDKSLTQDSVMSIFKQYSVDLGDKGFDNTYGWGLINLSQFDITKKPTPTTPSTPPETEPNTTAPVETEPNTTAPAETEPETTVPPATDPTVPETILTGDVNGDGAVTVSDATCIQKKLAGITLISFNEQAADTNGDGVVSIDDATTIQRYIAKMIPSLPYSAK